MKEVAPQIISTMAASFRVRDVLSPRVVLPSRLSLRPGLLTRGLSPAWTRAALMPSRVCGSTRCGVGADCVDFLLGSLGMRGTGASGLTVACSRWPGFLQQPYLLKYTVLHYTVACS